MSGILLVTGGARGIGAATARLAAKRGYRVAVNYRSASDAAQVLIAEIEGAGGRAVAVQADVAHEDDVVRLFREVDQGLGRITALVNSAGIGHIAAVRELAQAPLERLLAVNVIGTILCCREAVRRMSMASGGAGGAIVNVSSMASTIGGRPGRCAYAASKGAVDSFTRGLAREVAAEGIRANALRPGMTLTPMTESVLRDPERQARIVETIPINRVARAEEMANAILWLLSDEASFISGALLDASGGGYVIDGG